MTRGQQYSLIMHGLILVIMIFGLPEFLRPEIEPEPIAISVDILPVAPISNVKPQEKTPEPKPDKKPEIEKTEAKKATVEAKKEPEKAEEPIKVSAKEMVKEADVPLPDKPKEVVKPEPKKSEPKPEPKKIEKKQDDLESILKAVEDSAKAEESKKPKEAVVSEKKNKAVSEVYDESLPLSMSEKDGIRNQIQRCWNVPAGAKDAANLIVTLRIELNDDGSVINAELAADKGRYNSDSFFRAAADSAMRAVRKCSPLKNLPTDKYNSWRDMELTFNPKDAL